MLKRSRIIIFGAIIIVCLAGGFQLVQHLSSHGAIRQPVKWLNENATRSDTKTVVSAKGAPPTPTVPASYTHPTNTACQFLPYSVASTVIGADTVTKNADSGPAVNAAGVDTYTCTYTSSTAHGITLTLISRLASSSSSDTSNAVSFNSSRPDDAVNVSSYGQAAYWISGSGKLNILNDDNWYTLSQGEGTPPKPASLQETEGVAKLIIAKFQ
jgi:hypothetical protein